MSTTHQAFLSRAERFASVGSTNDLVRAWLDDGVPEVCLAVADEQTAGRGREGRPWEAPPGAALLLSLGFRPTWLPPDRVWRLAAIVSLAMADAAEEVAGLPEGAIRLKWPNDLVIEAAGARALVAAETDAAEAAARLAHPHIAAVYDVGTHGGDVYVAMEYVEGPTLRAWMKAPHPWAERRDVLLQAARGLAAAHARGVTHRDFKPENVIVGYDGRVRVLDFGLAKLAPRTATRTEDTTDTQVGAIVGTPRYMAPEQLRGQAAGPAADGPVVADDPDDVDVAEQGGEVA